MKKHLLGKPEIYFQLPKGHFNLSSRLTENFINLDKIARLFEEKRRKDKTSLGGARRMRRDIRIIVSRRIQTSETKEDGAR